MKSTLIALTGVAALAMLPAAPVYAAEVSATPSVVSNSTFALSGQSGKRAQWQERLTLGPGDLLNISMLATPDDERKEILIDPDSVRSGVLVGPDGRINYREVQNLTVTGLTVDELRAKLDAELAKFYLSPRSVVTPVAYRSKKYYLLGAVGSKGVFPLERPTTVIEAVARAGGLETGIIGNNPMEMADLTHSFLVRDGKRLPVNFEQLFQRGDLSQNVPIEPNDFLFFQPAGLHEIYVLGQVNAPGAYPWDPAATIISAITRNGSFTPVAYRQKVLVVRGSINKPETFVVNTAAILKGEIPDFKLQPGDIVYVSAKPWQGAQDLIESAIAAFVTSAFVTYAGENIGPFIEEPIIK